MRNLKPATTQTFPLQSHRTRSIQSFQAGDTEPKLVTSSKYYTMTRPVLINGQTYTYDFFFLKRWKKNEAVAWKVGVLIKYYISSIIICSLQIHAVFWNFWPHSLHQMPLLVLRICCPKHSRLQKCTNLWLFITINHPMLADTKYKGEG